MRHLVMSSLFVGCEDKRDGLVDALTVPSFAAGVLVVACVIVLSLRLRVASIVLGAMAIAVGMGSTASSGCAMTLSTPGEDMQAMIATGASILCFILGILAVVLGVGMAPDE